MYPETYWEVTQDNKVYTFKYEPLVVHHFMKRGWDKDTRVRLVALDGIIKLTYSAEDFMNL